MAKKDTWSKPPKKSWMSTLAFQRFRQKHGNLSRIYWSWQLGLNAVRNLTANAQSSDFVVDVVGTDFKRGMIPDTCQEFEDREDARTGVFRLYLLLICSANLEAYLQDSIRLFVANSGHATGPFKLDAVGEAIARPVLNSSTVPSMLKYIQDLTDITFGEHLTRWQKAYKLRCSAAHNGGFADEKTKKNIPDLKIDAGEAITISWNQLITYLSSADEIAAFIDSKISTPKLRSLECEWELHRLKADGKLPANKQDLWMFAHSEFSGHVLRKEKLRIERELYNS